MENQPTIAYLTAGAAGMICGSCLRDNALARALAQLGCDIHLIPMYTPIRTDEEDFSTRQVFFGGINVFLQEKVPLFRFLPRFLDRWLDQPWLIRAVATRGMQTEARQLGALTVSMLRGTAGHQRKEVYRLVRWLQRHVRPRLVNFSNILIAGCARALKDACNVPMLVTLQGDDIFLEGLVEPYRSQALAEIRRLSRDIDGYITFSQYYADYMAEYLSIPRDRIHLVPLGISLEGFAIERSRAHPRQRPLTVGYLARVCPAKGFDLLVDGFLHLCELEGMETVRLSAAGWLGPSDRQFFERQRARLTQAGLADRFDYAGVVDRETKIAYLEALDVFSVPARYREPKGLYVLEALAAGVPVVQPSHGAFAELVTATGGGLLTVPGDPRELAAAWHRLLTNAGERAALGQAGRERVAADFTAVQMAQRTLDVYRQYLASGV